MKNKKYYSLFVKDNEANISIHGDITSWEWYESDVSSYTLSKELDSLGDDIDTINVYINSYGGEVAEGLAIYNALKRHKAKVRTYCDGFACSIASVIFMAGEERIMPSASLLMIHNAWTWASGNASELRKQAEDLDVIMKASINAYMNHVTITEDELKEMLDNETWITPEDALEKGFATRIEEEEVNNVSQSVKSKVIAKLTEETQETATLNVIDFKESIIKEIKALKLVETPQEPIPQKSTDNEQENKLKQFLIGLSQRKEG